MKKMTCFVLLTLAMCFAAPAAAEAVAVLAEGAGQAPVAAIDVTGIATALMSLLGAIITAYIVPWLKAKLGAERYESALSVTRTLVEAAEQIFSGPGRGQEKLEYVKGELAKRGVSYDQAKIEAAVWGLGSLLFEDVTGIEQQVDE